MPDSGATCGLKHVRLVLSHVRDTPVNLALLHGLRDNDYKGHLAVTAYTAYDAEQLERAGGKQPPGEDDRNNAEDLK